MENRLIEINIEKIHFGNLSIFKNFNMLLKPGTCIGLMGKSGIGKTSLLRIIAKIDNRFEGKLIGYKNVSFMFQEPFLLPWRTVEENISIATNAKHAEILKSLKNVGLEDKINSFPNILSLGEQRRVSLVRTMLFQSDLMLLDEPFASLDKTTKVFMHNIICDYKLKQQQSMILVSHDERDFKGLTTKIINLDKYI